MTTPDKPRAARKPSYKGKRGGEVLEAVREDKAKKRRVASTKYNWDLIRETFINNPNMSLRQLSTDMNIPYDYLRQRASEERWTYVRVEEQRRIFKQKREEQARKNLEAAGKFDEASAAVATLGQQLVMRRLAEIAELHAAYKPTFNTALRNIHDGTPVRREELYSPIRFTELKELALAAKVFQEMGRTAYGIENLEKAIADASGDTGVESVISVSAELGKDDPRRVAAMLEAFARAGLAQVLLSTDDEGTTDESADDENTIEGEVIPATNVTPDSDGPKELTAS